MFSGGHLTSGKQDNSYISLSPEIKYSQRDKIVTVIGNYVSTKITSSGIYFGKLPTDYVPKNDIYFQAVNKDNSSVFAFFHIYKDGRIVSASSAEMPDWAFTVTFQI